MPVKTEIDNLTIRGEIALAVFALSELHRQIPAVQPLLKNVLQELKIWLGTPVEGIAEETSIILYGKYSEMFLEAMTKATDKMMNEAFSISYHIFLFVLHVMEGAEYVRFPGKTTEPASDVIEEDTALFAVYLADCKTFLNDESFDTKLNDLFQSLLPEHLFTADNVIGTEIDMDNR